MSRPGDLDLVLLGATGFTGRLTARRLAASAPPGLRWAVAGRDAAKLDAVRADLGPGVEVREADVTDASSLARLASSTRALVTTVGPYARHGDAVVGACAEAGTDYLDITGEAEFVDRTWLRHHETARRTGARLVHACGFDSVPHDLGALFTVQQLPEDVPIRLRGYVTARGLASGGTFESALTAMSRARQTASTAAERRRREPRSGTRRARAVAGRPGYDAGVRRWVVPLPTIDPQVVARSARTLDRYGPDFTYSHFAAGSNPLVMGAGTVAVAGLAVLAQVPPARRLLLRARPSGSGPASEQIEKGWFRVRFVGEGGGERVVTEVAGGDPGYGATSTMLAASALCLLLDDVPETSGQVTTAVALGDALRRRLEPAGITFSVLER